MGMYQELERRRFENVDFTADVVCNTSHAYNFTSSFIVGARFCWYLLIYSPPGPTGAAWGSLGLPGPSAAAWGSLGLRNSISVAGS